MPSDATPIDDDRRIMIMKKINVCENNRQLLETGVIDQFLNSFSNETAFVCPAFSAIEVRMCPYMVNTLVNIKLVKK